MMKLNTAIFALGLAGLLGSGSANAVIMIDDFNTDQATISGGGSSQQDVTGTNVIIGGERDISTSSTTNANGSVGVSSGSLNYLDTNAANDGGSSYDLSFNISWDGDDGSQIFDTDGLLSTDFTEGGTNTGLRLFVSELTGTQFLQINVHSSGYTSGGTQDRSYGLLELALGENFISFTDFSPIWISAGVDFTDVVSLKMNNTFAFSTAGSFSIDFIEVGNEVTNAVPAPATLGLFGFALAGIGFLRRRGS